MSLRHERLFYELMWQGAARNTALPRPWWVQQYFRSWVNSFDDKLFDTKESSFLSNAFYRYWNMVGVKDHHQESLIGQAGEIEPVYDEYALSFFLFDPQAGQIHYPQFAGSDGASTLKQGWERGYLPISLTTYESALDIEVQQKVLATTVGSDQRSVVLARFAARLTGAAPVGAWLCLLVSPFGPTGFQRRVKGGQDIVDRRVTWMRYLQGEQRVLINATWGPTFDAAPDSWGLYGNNAGGGVDDAVFYLDNGFHTDLLTAGALNGAPEARDDIAGLCMGVFAWQMNLTPNNDTFTLDVRLPVDDYRGAGDLAALRADAATSLEDNNRDFWEEKLDRSGLQASLPPKVRHLFDLFRICRANVLMLSDEGQIHPGPTIYDSFWIRDSSVEGIACALSGDLNLPEQQFGSHYRQAFNQTRECIGSVSLYGFFGGEHERNGREWDSNGQALWAIGRFDRVRGRAQAFGDGMFSPYVQDGARWLHDNRDQYGLLHSGWSAEHLGDPNKPHYWDDFWGLAGLYEAARLARRIGASESAQQELWDIYDDLTRATRDSILYVLARQRERGFRETFIPTGPADIGGLDSTMIGAVAYFHPCRLYMGQKLGQEVDNAARSTLDTIWAHFMDGGFRHDSQWNCYGPYLTLQLAHAFLLTGQVERMDQCLRWAVYAAYARVNRGAGQEWQAVCGAWNEQHCFPVAKDFAEVPQGSWYMGDIPHGWACAEFMLLLRDILFFEADEDADAHIYLAPGVLPDWVDDGEVIGVSHAPTVFGGEFGFTLTHDEAARTVTLAITQPSPGVRFVYPCRFGAGVASIQADGNALPVTGNDVNLPAGTRRAIVTYL